MAKPTADTDKELIQQLRNLKAEMEERMDELIKRNYIVEIAGEEYSFSISISKNVSVEEIV